MKTRITVIPLGPGAPELLTLQAAEALQAAKRLVLRTDRHPVAEWLRTRHVSFESLDSFYADYEDFDRMHQAMAAHLWDLAAAGPVAFAVADPSRDGAVRFLRETAPEPDALRTLAGVSLTDACEPALPADLSRSEGCRICTASDFASVVPDPTLSLWIVELDSVLLAGDVKLRLADLYGDEREICFFPPSEKANRPCKIIPLYLLDSQKAYDHTTALFIPGAPYLSRDRFTFSDLTAIMTRLRAPDGCPWDRVQSHDSLTPYMVEEAWEVVSAIEDGDMDHLSDELGDVLLQVFFHASIAESFDEFTMTDVVSHICEKMIRRHPHLFRNPKTPDQRSDMTASWEALKRQETGSRTVGESLNDVSPALPSLKYAIKIYKKLAQLPALRRAPEEIAGEISALAGRVLQEGTFSGAAMTELLLRCTELCRVSDQDAEILLHGGVDDLKRRAQAAEKAILREGKKPEDLSSAELLRYLKPDS
ncbi:MAG: MazG family protein [Clostridia bacterium]|nr:MazG family protein [Clostridia bacterium]